MLNSAYSDSLYLRSAGFCWHHICEPETTAYDLASAALCPIADKAAGADAIVYATYLPLNGMPRLNTRGPPHAQLTRLRYWWR